MMSLKSSTNTILRPLLRKNVHLATTRSMTILSKESKEEHKKQNYNARMAKTGRPVSPHVTIYSFPITALTSITNRVTGVALSIGAFGIASIELLNGSGSAMLLMQDINANTGAIVGSMAKFTVSFPIVYHYLGGVRHLAWDKFPEMLTNVDVVKASYGLVGSSLVISTGLALL